MFDVRNCTKSNQSTRISSLQTLGVLVCLIVFKLSILIRRLCVRLNKDIKCQTYTKKVKYLTFYLMFVVFVFKNGTIKR